MSMRARVSRSERSITEIERAYLSTYIKQFGLTRFDSLYQQSQSLKSMFDIEVLSKVQMPASIVKSLHALSEGILDSNMSKGLDELRNWLDGGSNRHLVSLDCDAYPKRLKEVHLPPPFLFCEGDISLFNEPAIAVVGSRKVSPRGRRLAHTFAHQLSLSGVSVVSGMALGVDTAAHQGALDATGRTIAVTGTGINLCYPQRNKALKEDIGVRGLVCSEFRLGTPPVAANFPRRNRIISGLCSGVLVVEANVKSGSLVTARYAAEQNREVFAIPGPIDSAGSKGCHFLIKQGACLVESVEDIYDELAWVSQPACSSLDSSVSEKGQVESSKKSGSHPVLVALQGGSLSSDELLQATGLNTAELSSELVALELEGLVSQVPGGYQAV